MQRSHRTLAEHQFDLADATFILHDCAFEVAVRRHDDTLGRRQRPEARQRLHIAIPPSFFAARRKRSRAHGLPPSASPRLRVNPNISRGDRSEEHTSELQSLMRISYAVFCLKKKTQLGTAHTCTTNTTTHPSS